MGNRSSHTPLSQASLDRAVAYFNINPDRGVTFLLTCDERKPGVYRKKTGSWFYGDQTQVEAKAITFFLFTVKGLSKDKIGEYLGSPQERNILVTKMLAKEIIEVLFAAQNYTSKDMIWCPPTFTRALREFLSRFKLPGEAQKIDRILEAFAEAFHGALVRHTAEHNKVSPEQSCARPGGFWLKLTRHFQNGYDDYDDLDGGEESEDEIEFDRTARDAKGDEGEEKGQNPCWMQDASTLHVLAFSTVLLNTDMHNTALSRNHRKMTQQQFVRNNRGIDGGRDPPRRVLEEIYDDISKDAISLGNTGKGKTTQERSEFDGGIFAEPSLEGWLEKRGADGRWRKSGWRWKQRYCLVTADNSLLYYFKNKHDVNPMGFIVLEGVEAKLLLPPPPSPLLHSRGDSNASSPPPFRSETSMAAALPSTPPPPPPPPSRTQSASALSEVGCRGLFFCGSREDTDCRNESPGSPSFKHGSIIEVRPILGQQFLKSAKYGGRESLRVLNQGRHRAVHLRAPSHEEAKAWLAVIERSDCSGLPVEGSAISKLETAADGAVEEEEDSEAEEVSSDTMLVGAGCGVHSGRRQLQLFLSGLLLRRRAT